jgi:transposase
VSRFRLYPPPEQEGVLLAHCAHARFVWNLAVEQQSMYTPRKGPVPNYTAQSRQLTEARGEFAWLAAGSQTVPAAYTSVRCNTCGEVDRASRESQAVFRCRSCRHTAHADVNAARNIRDIAAGRAVIARAGTGVPGPVNR